MRRRRPHLNRPKRSLDLLWPFLLIILIGLVVALLVQFVFTWLDQREAELKNKVYLYQDRGSASVLPWGGTDWGRAYDGQLVLEGDLLRMGPASRGVLRFFDDSVVRLDADAKVEIQQIEQEEAATVLHLKVSNGSVWIHATEVSDEPTRFIVTTDHLRITSYGPSLEVSVTDREVVRVMEGEALVEAVNNENAREVVLEQIKVGVGQEVEVTAQDLERIWARQPVSLLAALNDDWKLTEWFRWNRAEDDSSVLFAEQPSVEATPEAEVVVPVEETEVVAEEAVVSPLELAITAPKTSPFEVTQKEDLLVMISGTVTQGASTVTVTSYAADGTASPYVLRSYTAGALTWSYRAHPDYGNLREGRNRFTVVAATAEGVKSSAVELIVQVKEGLLEEEVEEPVAEAAAESTATPEATPVPASVSGGPVTAPMVTSFNGASASGRYTTSAESVTVVGSVGAGATAVYVNDYKLGKYTAGSGEWSYVLKPDFGNFAPGLNSFTVVAEAADGTKASTTFEVYRTAP